MWTRFMTNFRKPTGLMGRMVVALMNKGHAAMTRAVLDAVGPGEGDVVLDIGCGGGLAVKLLAERTACVYGIDMSEVSVAKTIEVNQDAVRQERVRVMLSDVLGMPFNDGMFDLATAFETIYFWENIDACFKRVCEALKPGGRFVVAVEAWKSPEGGNNFPAIFSAVNPTLYSADEIASLVTRAGFARAAVLTNGTGNWLCVSGWKRDTEVKVRDDA
ncbi:MAG: methyltransferase domain-containing protein [Planctomycetaceae bacterium]|nr:methyltransferase domain-containing protein [Planctomycetaceae bacterium]